MGEVHVDPMNLVRMNSTKCRFSKDILKSRLPRETFAKLRVTGTIFCQIKPSSTTCSNGHLKGPRFRFSSCIVTKNCNK